MSGLNLSSSHRLPFAEDAEQPLRGELFSIEHLRVRAVELANSLTIIDKAVSDDRFSSRFQQNAEYLDLAYGTISQAVRDGEPLTPEAEWLLDNFYVVQEHRREIHEDLPTGYFNELPKVASGDPRVYQLALELIVHTDSVIQHDDLVAFVDEFQGVAPLSIGEMWALPIMLRLALLENLRRLTSQMLASLKTRRALNTILRAWQIGDPLPEELGIETARPDVVANTFSVLGDLFPDDPPRFAALEQAALERFTSSTEIIRAEHRRQAENQVSIGNVITSMRLISALDWMSFFEQTNLAERHLREDPAGIYSMMKPETRNRYRNAIEELAKQSHHSDILVARRALQRSQVAMNKAEPSTIRGHVGYWLVDEGRAEFERELGFQPKRSQLLSRWILRHPETTYFGAIASILGLGLLFCLSVSMAAQLSLPVALILIALAILPLSEFAVSLMNWVITHGIPPKILPKLELKDGVPEQFRTFVIVPALLTGRKEVAALLERLEMHYVRNSEPQLRFALLTDFSDAPTETMEADTKLVEQAVAGIRMLNARYSQEGRQPFYLFHRRRKWNEREGVWMGWERKRGKVVEFNRLLHGDQATSYSILEGDLSVLAVKGPGPAFPFIITLDSDTQLPLEAARQMIGTLAHPLNRPQLNAERTCVVHGFTILQPRVSVQLSEGNKSRFTQLFANARGIDPYGTAASDVYQDLFGEGSFTGKGIYDVGAFETILGTAFEENQILSHDLIEGCHVRVGLVSDIELNDGYPTRYDADARRSHRWVRGDWQIMPWLFRQVPVEGGCQPNRLSALSKWKIFDNLRRSLVAPAICLFLLASWFLAPEFASLFAIVAWLAMAFPIIAGVVGAIRNLPGREFWMTYARSTSLELLRTALQTVVLVACLPHKAYLMLDAVARTLVRVMVTRRRMLEWETAAAAEGRLARNQWSILRDIAFVPILSIAVAIALPTAAWLAAAPWLLAWLLSPLIAHWISQPFPHREPVLAEDDKQWLRLMARNTWSYFETCVNSRTNWLPPDNLQEYPDEKLAERISPTNEGLFLVALLAARDFGFIGMHSMLDLCEKNLATWRTLPHLNGHFYNWYDTANLQALVPRYVSTVDSGNLAASLLVLERGMGDAYRSPVFGDSIWLGLNDTLTNAVQACEQLHPRGARMVSPPLENLSAMLSRLRELQTVPPTTWSQRHAALQALLQGRDQLPLLLQVLQDTHRHPTSGVEASITSLIMLINGLEADLSRLAPWIGTLAGIDLKIRDYAGDEPLQTKWAALRRQLDDAQSAEQFARVGEAAAGELAAMAAHLNENNATGLAEEVAQLTSDIESGARGSLDLITRCRSIGRVSEQMALDMKFGFLFDPERRLFSIGFNLEVWALDRGHYDMLCSEARLSSYLAIAKGDIAYKHWFQLGRQLTVTAGQQGLLSWGGTMFEYLMPLLFQRSFPGSLLTQACEAAVARQQEYGLHRGVPWGVSESAFAALAINSDYSYQSFGVPGLGLKRGLNEDLVVAPYATMLALTIAPSEAVANLRRLAAEGGLGRFGFYDAVDYSPVRVPARQKSLPVRCYMAHHQAMSIAAIANVLLNQIVERRFHAHPLVKATEMLLQEAVPSAAPVLQPHVNEITEARGTVPEEVIVSRRMVGFETPHPRTHLLSNGTYSVMVTNTGGGYSQSQGLAINRWRPDGLNDHGGQFIYIRDRHAGQVWSATYQPTCKRPDFYEVIFSIDKAEYRRRDGDIETHLEIVVSPDNNVEHRQLKLTNHGRQVRELEITSYVEVTLTSPAADLAHPAFQKLFVETEFIAEEAALIAKRRPRDSHDKTLWAFHVLASLDTANEKVQYESSRQAFLGRGRDYRFPAAMRPGSRLTGTSGLVLDPIFALRCVVSVNRNDSAGVAFTTGTAESRDMALRLVDQFHEQRSVLRAFELAWVFNQVELHHLHLTAAKAQRFQQLASLLLFPQAHSRGSDTALRMNRIGQSGLWKFGISGDRPILLVNVGEVEHVEFVRELLLAQEYWEHHGLIVDLVVLNTHPGSYLDMLQERLNQIVQETPRKTIASKNTIFLLRAAQISREDQWLLEAAAQVVIAARRGWLAMMTQSTPRPKDGQPGAAGGQPAEKPQLSKREPQVKAPVSGMLPARSGSVASLLLRTKTHSETLEFWNGFGGFAASGREYHVQLQSTKMTPSPWSNVIANPRFGCLVTEKGGGYTWAANSRQNKLTSWSNDPVLDPASEILYLRDDETGSVWQALDRPQNPSNEAWVHHGQGYSRFVRTENDLDQEVLISIAPDDPVKLVSVKLQNRGLTERKLTACYYAEFVLGVSREQSQMHLITEVSQQTGALLVRNAYHPTYSSQVAFLQVIGPNPSSTGDRASFVGRNGDIRNPPGLRQPLLSGKTGAGLDCCGAIQSQFRLAAGESIEIVFLLGCGRDFEEATHLLNHFQTLASVREALNQTVALWDSILTTIQVTTPNRAFDILVNRWMLYQVLSCRFWGRSAFYQSGGAYGFRDQLQDVMALVYSRPDLAREQLLLAASRQFEEGDVQHWWHPPLGEGTRTRFSDDLLWLPFVTAQYVNVTGDADVLDEVVPFLHSPTLNPEEQERYELPQVSSQQGSLYDHCRRTLERGFRLGAHGLPLMGCGDWNDGMNHVGKDGRGESVWVGWFLLSLLDDFLPLAERRNDHALVDLYRGKAVELRAALEQHAWDGQWYRRAFFDDGTPLGSQHNDECKIDSLAQTWAVLAHADSDRTDQALEAVFKNLVSDDERMVTLFAPPFDKTALDPGYIKGYLPGVRENGGQYTHAVLWLIQALTMKGDGDRAMKIFDYVNPILHARDVEEVRKYCVEPYVVAADVYSIAPHTGRGGWSWYTGSAAWTYRVALESILGLTLRGNQLHFQPCVPANWEWFQIKIRRGSSTWHLTVETPQSDRSHASATNGHLISATSESIELIDDGQEHHHTFGRKAERLHPRSQE